MNIGIHYCNDEQLLKDENAKVLLPQHFSCHTLRHTFTTRMCEAGVNVKVIQDALGHTDILTTLKIYIDVTKELRKAEFEGLDMFFEGEYTNKTTESSTRMLPILGWDILGTTNSVTIEYSGVINVGYDMNEIDYELSDEDAAIYVTLPEAKVLDNYIKFDDLNCVCDNNILNPIKTDSVMEYFKEIEQEELVKAEADEIYEKANEQLEEIVKGYLGVVPEYKVRFRK